MLFAVIPTIGERNDTLVPMVNQLLRDGVGVIIVENGEKSVPTCEFINGGWLVLSHDWLGTPVNLSMLWNIGLDAVSDIAGNKEHVVAILNDDLVLPPGLVDQLALAIMPDDDVVASFAASFGNTGKLDASSPLHLGNRMSGYAFALRGSARLRADERFLWWWGDTDLDIQARKAGGIVGVTIPGLEHRDPNGYTNRRPELAAQAGRDRATFLEKHGFLPW